MKQAGTEFGVNGLRFEKDVTDAVLSEAGALGVLVRLPVPAPLRTTVRTALDRLREGEPIRSEVEGEALRDAVESVVGEYETHLTKRRDSKLKNAGVKPPAGSALAPIERIAIQAFVLWALREDQRRRAEGHRGADLDKAAQAFDE
jgi:hypothetical protein